MIILASFDFFYYHNLELVFYDVSFTDVPACASWWDHWSKDQLEFDDTEFEDGYNFKFNVGTSGDKQFAIRTKGFSYYLERFNYNG